MKVVNETPKVAPGQQPALPDGKGRGAEGRSCRTGFRDTVQISSEARNMQSRGAMGSDRSQLERGRLDGIKARLDAEFYDSAEVRLTVAEEILRGLGL